MARRLTVRYGKVTALADVDFAVPSGTITAVLGPSGCGKTTLLSCINRLIDLFPECRAMGEIRVGGLSVLDPKTDVVQLRRTVGMVFQNPNPFPMSIRRNLTLPLREHGIANDRTERYALIEDALNRVGLWDEVRDRLHQSALRLSGGQQQRLCIARALVLEPTVLLMDEPCSNLDPISAAKIESVIRSLRGSMTVIMVTHNLEQARRLADHVALLWPGRDGGRLVEWASSEDFFRRPGSPVARAYVQAGC